MNVAGRILAAYLAAVVQTTLQPTAWAAPNWLALLALAWLWRRPTLNALWTAGALGLLSDLCDGNVLGPAMCSQALVACAVVRWRRGRAVEPGLASWLAAATSLLAIELGVVTWYVLLGQTTWSWQVSGSAAAVAAATLAAWLAWSVLSRLRWAGWKTAAEF